MTSDLPLLLPLNSKMPFSTSSVKVKISYLFTHSDQTACQTNRTSQTKSAESEQGEKRRRRDFSDRFGYIREQSEENSIDLKHPIDTLN